MDWVGGVAAAEGREEAKAIRLTLSTGSGGICQQG